MTAGRGSHDPITTTLQITPLRRDIRVTALLLYKIAFFAYNINVKCDSV